MDILCVIFSLVSPITVEILNPQDIVVLPFPTASTLEFKI